MRPGANPSISVVADGPRVRGREGSSRVSARRTGRRPVPEPCRATEPARDPPVRTGDGPRSSAFRHPRCGLRATSTRRGSHGPYPATPPRHGPEPPGDLSPGDQRGGPADGRRGEDAGPADRRRATIAARDRMVRANLRLVVNIARGYVGKGLALQDLIEEGNLGLLRAVEGFDPAVGTRFSTYASYWIKQSIKRALVNTAKPIRIPAYMVELLFKWRRDGRRAAGRARPAADGRGDRPVARPAQEEAGDRQEGDQGLQPRPADRPARERLEPGRDAHGRAHHGARTSRWSRPTTCGSS